MRGGEHKGREGEKRMVGTMEKDGRRECDCERREGRKRKTEQERGMERRMKQSACLTLWIITWVSHIQAFCGCEGTLPWDQYGG